MDAVIDVSKLGSGNRAGILMMGGQYTCLYLEKKDGQCRMVLAESQGDDKDKQEIVKASAAIAQECKTLKLRMVFLRPAKGSVSKQGEVEISNPNAEDLYFNNYDAPKPELRMFYSVDEGPMCDSSCRFTPSDHTWVGAKTGLFVTACKGAEAGSAVFLSVNYNEL